MRFSLLAFFVLTSARLFAQSLSDTVRPGIKTVTHRICGYGENGDSTGMLLVSENNYNASGHLLTWKCLGNMRRLGNTKPTNESWFYRYRAINQDSIRYSRVRITYTSSGDIAELNTGEHHTIYNYNRRGQLISIESEYTLQKYKYRRRSEVEIFCIAGHCHPSRKWEYDRSGRLQRKIQPGDTTVYSYTAAGKTETRFQSINKRIYSISSKKYDRNDSLLNQVLYREDNGALKMSDSLRIERDSSGRPLHSYEESHGNLHQVEYGTYIDGLKVKEVSVKEGDTITKTWRYEKNKPVEFVEYSGNGVWCKRLWMYNAQGDLEEMRLYNGKGVLVQREVYTYTYY